MTDNVVILEPPEARGWPLARVRADYMKQGDYLVRNGYEKVLSVRSFEPYDGIQIKTNKVVYSSDASEYHWVLMSPRNP